AGLRSMLRAYPMASRSAKNWASVKLPGLAAKETRAVLQSGFFYVRMDVLEYAACCVPIQWPADPRKTGQALSFLVYPRKEPALFCRADFFMSATVCFYAGVWLAESSKNER